MAKKPPAGSISEQLLAHLPANRRPHWEDGLPADIRAELEAIKADYVAGRYGGTATRTGLSIAIAKTLSARGLPGSAHTVARWLGHD